MFYLCSYYHMLTMLIDGNGFDSYLFNVYLLLLFIYFRSLLYSRLTSLTLMFLSYQLKIKLAGFQFNCAFYGKSLTYPPDGSSSRRNNLPLTLESKPSLKFDFR